MLESIRKQTGSLVVKALLGLLVISFALWGIGDIFQGRRDLSVARVGGGAIAASELQTEYTRIVENLRRSQGIDAEQARALGALESALDGLIGREVLRREATAIGVAAPDSEVLRTIENNPVFHDLAGRFDRSTYNAILFQNSLTPQSYEETVRQDIRRSQLADSMAVGVQPVQAVIRNLQKHIQQGRIAEALTLSAAGLNPPVPGQIELQNYFDENRDAYRAPEYRRVTAVLIRPIDFLDQVDVSDEEVREEYEYRIDEFVTPERRDIDQMVFPDRAAADTARARLVGGADFYTVGADLLGLSESDMNLGLLTENDLASPDLGAAAFTVIPGESTQPVETPFGWTVLRVREAIPGETRDLASVADMLRQERTIILAQDVAADLSDEFEDARAGGAALEQAARAVGLQPLLVGPVDRLGRLRNNAAGASAPPLAEFLPQAFAATPDEETSLLDIDDGTWFALRVDDVIAPTERRLADVRDRAISDWQDQWRSDRLAEQGAAMAERLRAGETAAAVAADTGAALHLTTPILRNAGSAGPDLGPAFISAMFDLEPDGISDPVSEGDRIHVARLVEIIDIDAEDADQAVGDRIANQLLSSQVGDIAAIYSEELRRKYDVMVNQAALERFFGN